MKFAHQSATIRQHGKGMIILETALETAGLTYVFPDGNGIKNIAFQVHLDLKLVRSNYLAI